MGQCRTLDADVTIGCYYSDYSSCDNTIPTPLYNWNKKSFAHTCKFVNHDNNFRLNETCKL